MYQLSVPRVNLFAQQHHFAHRVMCKSKYNAHTDPLFIKLNTLKVKDIFHCQCLKFFYQHENNNTPSYFKNLIVKNINDHTHNTRQRDTFSSINTNKISTDKILRHYLPKFLKIIPGVIVNRVYTHSLQSVKLKFKH